MGRARDTHLPPLDIQLHFPLFGLFLLLYGITLVGNGGMILLITIDPRLHTPLYFFLRNLSFSDLCLSSTISPQTLLNFLAERKNISFTACAVQMSLSNAFADSQGFLLTVVAYDCYVAICNLLLCTVTMSRQLCKQLVAGVYVLGVLDSMIFTCFTFWLSFCSSDLINHFSCEFPPLLALSCSDTCFIKIMMFVFTLCVTVSILWPSSSPMSISLSTILQICYTECRRKAFSTCIFHLTTVALYFVTLLFMYLRPTSSNSMDRDIG
ncbi:olfactory receptor-like protein OLF1 [Dermochelys coriacea]|uniref:olfactory receptor-like protein OLF1 n=1 Tax=Dermochelys coriacea TaxID=27794 RepID=UPI001CA9D8BD|nr:olfactory receptor-like protein OLF1 [Dermochelys coriacea]